MRISDWSSDVCSSDLSQDRLQARAHLQPDEGRQVPQGAAPGRARGGLGLGGDRTVDRRAPQRTRLTLLLGSCHSTRRSPCRWCPSFRPRARSEEHTSELQSLMRISYAVFCLKKKLYN